MALALTLIDFFAIFVFSVLGLMIILSTIYDVLTRNKPYEPKKIFIAFSLYTNVRELLKVEPKNPKSFDCFHGLRGISTFWVIAGHRIFRHDRMVSKKMKIESLFAKIVIAVVMTNGYAVDIFFLISGVLVTQSCLRSLDANKLNLLKIYFNRYMRYVPTVAVLLLFFMSSFQFFLVDGPQIDWLERLVDTCYTYWWSSLLLVQNYVNVFNVCMGVTWYLSADFHLFLISPIFIYLLWKFQYKALWLFGMIILSTQVSIFFARYEEILDTDVIYRQTHFRIAQFLIGIVLGYIMYQREGIFHMRRRSKIGAWIIFLGIFLAIELYHETNKSNKFAKAFYESTHRISFACLIGWIIFVCHHLRSGGVINWFLSHHLWQPIAKISLSIYLVHDIYIVLSVVNMKEPWYLDPWWLIHIFIGDLAISTMLGTLLYLVIEAPSNVILKYYNR